MEFVRTGKIGKYLEKYKYVWIVLCVGILLMLVPGNKDTPEAADAIPEATQPEDSVEERLEAILSQMNGAGKVRVMLSVYQGEQTIYQTDSDHSQSEHGTDSRTQTILITDKNRNETGLVHQINPPKYLGAIVLCQGADDPVVKLSIVEAVGKITGLGADRISVLKM